MAPWSPSRSHLGLRAAATTAIRRAAARATSIPIHHRLRLRRHLLHPPIYQNYRHQKTFRQHHRRARRMRFDVLPHLGHSGSGGAVHLVDHDQLGYCAGADLGDQKVPFVEQVNKAIELGVNDYLGKPYQEHDLLENINSVIEEKHGIA